MSQSHRFWLAALAAFHLVSQLESAELPSRLRRPIAVQLAADGRTLFAANQRSATLSIVDLNEHRVLAEHEIGKRLSDLARLPDGRLLATDEVAHQLLLLEVKGSEVVVRQRLAVARHPIRIAISADGRKACVSSLWSRRLTLVDIGETLVPRHTVDLAFAPRNAIPLGDRWFVADHFGGKLALVGDADGRILLERSLPAHHIRGLGVTTDGRMLAVAHQMLNELAHTTRNDVHWGLLMSNDLRWLKLEAMLDPQRNQYESSHMHPLGEAGNATGDPSALVVASNGTVIVALGGVGEISFGKENDFSFYRVQVGKRPTALAVSADSQFVYVANTFDDSISIVDLKDRQATATISLGPKPALTIEDRGELLFYDASLSHDGWMSCHSCHTDGHANGSLNDNFSDKSFGAPKRVLSLLGVQDTAPFAWSGQTQTLPEQVRRSIVHTMQGDDEPTERQIDAIVAFMKTFSLPPPLDEARGNRDAAAVKRGQEVFAANNCSRCHAPPQYTTPKTYNVGLKDAQGNDHFNPPSLRGVGQRGPAYFHDNRAASLEDVFKVHEHQLREPLKETELRDLLAFLRSL